MDYQLPLMPFDAEKIRLHPVYKSECLEQGAAVLDCPWVRQVYGRLTFPEPSARRPYLYTSLVTSIDGKIAFSDAPQGPLIARKNFCDPDGAAADWWLLNLLRAAADGIIVGTGTLRAEPDFTGHVFDEQLVQQRAEQGKPLVPWNIVSSLDGTDIPYQHLLFSCGQIPVMISTSRQALPEIEKGFGDRYQVLDCESEQAVQQAAARMRENPDVPGWVIVSGQKAPDSALLLLFLRQCGLERVLVETPSYMHYLLSQQMMDELFFNYSCLYVGGNALSIGKSGQEFTSRQHPHTRMLSIHAHSDHFFYFRHKLVYDVCENT